MRSAVVLPHPDGPTRMRNSPSADIEAQAVDGEDVCAELLADVVELNGCH